MLYGEYSCALDDKGRINFPARFRDVLGERFMVTRWMKNCLVAFKESEWEYISEQLSAMSSEKRRNLKLYLYSGAAEAKPDKQGRVLIPQKLREHACLGKDAVVVGVGRHAEIWDAEAWSANGETMDIEGIQSVLEELDF